MGRLIKELRFGRLELSLYKYMQWGVTDTGLWLDIDLGYVCVSFRYRGR